MSSSCPTCGPKVVDLERGGPFVSQMCRSCKTGARLMIHRRQANGDEYTAPDLAYMQKAKAEPASVLSRLTVGVVNAVWADDISAQASARMERRAKGVRS